MGNQVSLQNLEGNIWKMFVYIFTGRRAYISVLSIYFLTLPNTTANMLGLFTGIGNLAAFFFEIPSGYLADRFGHKKTLILAKVMMLISTASFIFIQNFYGFVLGSICMSISIAFTSGTNSAFMQETLERLGREKEYSKIMGRMRGNVSLASVALIILLPFLTKIDILWPFYVSLFLDILGLIVVFSFANPKNKIKISKNEIKSIARIFKDSRKLNFLPFAIFTSAIAGFATSEAVFRYVYLETLGYPIAWVGFVMGLSRLVWFFVGRYAHLIEEYFTMRQLLIFELLFFPGYFFVAAYLSNPYLIAAVIIVAIGYMWGRGQVIEGYILNNHISDKNYKATVISIKNQIGLFFQFVVPFSIGFIMNYSYKLGYAVLGICLFAVLLTSFFFINKKQLAR